MGKRTHGKGPSWLKGGKVLIVPAAGRREPTESDSTESKDKKADGDKQDDEDTSQ